MKVRSEYREMLDHRALRLGQAILLGVTFEWNYTFTAKVGAKHKRWHARMPSSHAPDLPAGMHQYYGPYSTRWEAVNRALTEMEVIRHGDRDYTT